MLFCAIFPALGRVLVLQIKASWVEGFSSATNPDYVEGSEEVETTVGDDESLDMYDVILAGVVSNGR